MYTEVSGKANLFAVVKDCLDKGYDVTISNLKDDKYGIRAFKN